MLNEAQNLQTYFEWLLNSERNSGQFKRTEQIKTWEIRVYEAGHTPSFLAWWILLRDRETPYPQRFANLIASRNPVPISEPQEADRIEAGETEVPQALDSAQFSDALSDREKAREAYSDLVRHIDVKLKGEGELIHTETGIDIFQIEQRIRQTGLPEFIVGEVAAHAGLRWRDFGNERNLNEMDHAALLGLLVKIYEKSPTVFRSACQQIQQLWETGQRRN